MTIFSNEMRKRNFKHYRGRLRIFRKYRSSIRTPSLYRNLLSFIQKLYTSFYKNRISTWCILFSKSSPANLRLILPEIMYLKIFFMCSKLAINYHHKLFSKNHPKNEACSPYKKGSYIKKVVES